METTEKKETWKQNLSTMKTNLQKTYDFKTIVQEESKLISGLKSTKKDYVIFSDYRRNEGRRRFEDVKDLKVIGETDATKKRALENTLGNDFCDDWNRGWPG